MDRSPTHLVKEIILVDDASDMRKYLFFQLDVKKCTKNAQYLSVLPTKVNVLTKI